jgi:hypothetical protein
VAVQRRAMALLLALLLKHGHGMYSRSFRWQADLESLVKMLPDSVHRRGQAGLELPRLRVEVGREGPGVVEQEQEHGCRCAPVWLGTRPAEPIDERGQLAGRSSKHGVGFEPT